MSQLAHTLHRGVPLAQAAQAALEASGEQWTGLRARVFAALAAFDQPASAYAIAERLSAQEGRRVAANTVYRILDLFIAANLARRVESANAYVVNGHPDCAHDCIFLVCDRCGRAEHVDDDALSAALRGAAARTGFNAERPVMEVRGSCADCGRTAPALG